MVAFAFHSIDLGIPGKSELAFGYELAYFWRVMHMLMGELHLRGEIHFAFGGCVEPLPLVEESICSFAWLC